MRNTILGWGFIVFIYCTIWLHLWILMWLLQFPLYAMGQIQEYHMEVNTNFRVLYICHLILGLLVFKYNGMLYKVRFYQNNTWEVLDDTDNSLFQGSLSDCEAWIRLKQNDDVDF